MWKYIIEIVILWILYALYMAIIVHQRGPIGGIFFYPKVMQDRVIELGYISKEEMEKRRRFAMVLLVCWMLVSLFIIIVIVNKAHLYWEICIQFYFLFLVTEFFDWFFIDTLWVALSDWWIIPGTEDLNDTWHSVEIKKWKMLKLIPFSIPLSMIVGLFYYFIAKLL